MILIGQYDSPFVRRVGIALRLYGLPFEHRPWSTFGDADRLMAINPTGSVPVLVLDDGTALVESKVILDHLDSLVPEERRLWPADRLGALRLSGFALQLGDRMISLFYERRLHTEASAVLQGRRVAQIAGTLALLERERAARDGNWWFGTDLTHADIAVACVLLFLQDSFDDLYDPERYPRLPHIPAAPRRCRCFGTFFRPSRRPPSRGRAFPALRCASVRNRRRHGRTTG